MFLFFEKVLRYLGNFSIFEKQVFGDILNENRVYSKEYFDLMMEGSVYEVFG